MDNASIRAENADRSFDRLNPVTGTVASRAEAMTVQTVVDLASKAGEALQRWSSVGPNARRDLLLRSSEALRARQDEIIEAMITEVGATEQWARGNVAGGATLLREAASLTTQIKGEVYPSDKPGCFAMSLREPAGVVLGIAPWNAPIILGVRAVATPLACGNTVILKASEACPQTHALIAQCFWAAGFPDGVVNFVTNAPEDGGDIVSALIDHPAVRRINFTGSTRIGKIIARRAAENLKPALLELGGKAPLIVLDDADLDKAVRAATFGAFFNQGQICMSTERIIVLEQVAEQFVDKLREKVASLSVGDPSHRNTTLGAVVDRRTVDHICGLVSDAVSQGALLVAGSESVSGVLMSPTVLDNVTPEMRLFREETFGPVVGVSRAKDEAQAIRLANDSDYGLTAAVFTRDVDRGLQVARRINSGMCHINGTTVSNEVHMPFGGVKSSGYGRFGGSSDIDFFTETRLITMTSGSPTYPI